MDQGEDLRDDGAREQGNGESVAEGAGARVAEILTEAERQAREIDAEAERAAAATVRAARDDARRILDDARRTAHAAGRDRAAELDRLRSSIASRAPLVLEGLEGAALTSRRIEELLAALAAAAERIVVEAGEPPAETDPEPTRPGAGAAVEPAAGDAKADADEPDAAADDAEPAADEPDAAADDAEPAAGEPDAAADDAEPAAGAPDAAADDAEAHADEADAHAEGDEASAHADGNGASRGDDSNGNSRYDGPLPEGAPMVRRPARGRDHDSEVRFAALLLAVQGRERAEVEGHLHAEYGVSDCDPILDEVFGRADAPA